MRLQDLLLCTFQVEILQVAKIRPGFSKVTVRWEFWRIRDILLATEPARLFFDVVVALQINVFPTVASVDPIQFVQVG